MESQASASQSSEPPRSEWDVLRDRLRENPRDADSWLTLVDFAEENKDYEKINETYEALLEAFPSTSSAQIAYIKHVLESSVPTRYQYAEALFKQFLKTSPFVDLWKYYLKYVQQMNATPAAKDTVRKAYDFALNHVGNDKESGPIWTDYIQLLKQVEANTPWEEGQKTDAVRKAYQRAVQIPMDNVKRLWEDWQEWENNLNKITAKKLIADMTPNHMQARTVLTNLQEHLAVLFPPPPPSKHRTTILLPRVPTFSAEEKALAARWRAYLKWEEANPLEIDANEKAQLQARLQSVYRKALVRMRFFPEIWFMAYTWTAKDRKEEATNLLKSGLDANPSSFLLNFAYVEILEENKKFDEVHAAFDKFFAVFRTELEAVEARIQSESSQTSSQGTSGGADDGPSSSQESNGSQQSEKMAKDHELSDRRKEFGVAWINYMRFARRAEGLKSARQIFGKSRKEKWTPWEVYEAAALLEYHCTKAADVAGRIFERGMETFPDEIELALRYLNFLISINDEANARALFERAVNAFPADKARPIWERWTRYEYQYGTLEASHLLEKRMAEVYPQDPPIKRFAERYKYLSCDAIAVHDLGFNSRGVTSNTSKSNANSIGKSETQQSLGANASSSQHQHASSAAANKRPSSPDPRRREESRSASEYGPPSKRPRPGSPPRGHDRERWDSSGRRRYGSPSPWERERERDGSHSRRYDREREDEKGVALPPILSWFVGTLPAPAAFDGPVFRTDDLMQVFRGASIPSSTGIRARSPSASARSTGGGRPPPDYSPYQGPGSGRRGRY